MRVSIGCWSTLSLVAYSFIKASYSDPGIITKANHARENQRYHADGVIYTTDRHCAQCDFARYRIRRSLSRVCVCGNVY